MKIPNPLKPASENITTDALHLVPFPTVATVKLDGVGCRFYQGVAYSPQNKPIRNLFVQQWAEKYPLLAGLQGELTASSFREATSLTAYLLGDITKLKFVAYDYFNVALPSLDYTTRLGVVAKRIERLKHAQFKLIKHETVLYAAELMSFYDCAISEGEEGLVLRDPVAPYKFGRCTVAEGIALKMKPYDDAEAEVIAVEPRMENLAKSTVNELGRAKKTKRLADLQPLQMLGAFVVVNEKGQKFRVSRGVLTDDECKVLWHTRNSNVVGRRITYKFLDTGGYEVPRSASFKCFVEV